MVLEERTVPFAPVLTAEETGELYLRCLISYLIHRSRYSISELCHKGTKCAWCAALRVDVSPEMLSQTKFAKAGSVFVLAEFDCHFGFSFSEWRTEKSAMDACRALPLENPSRDSLYDKGKGFVGWVPFVAKRPWFFQRDGELLGGSRDFVDANL